MDNQTYTLDDMGLDAIEQMNTPVDDLDSEVVNLMFVAIDGSGSMGSYVSTMKTSLNDFKDAIKNSKEADEILVARADFEGHISVGGYKKIDEFTTNYTTGGMTALYDVIVEGKNRLLQYMEVLKQQGMRVRAVFSVFSDGEDTSSKANSIDARKAIEELNAKEVTTAFISFGAGAMNEANSLKFVNVKQVGSDASELRKAFNVLSKSLVSNSKRVDTSANDQFFVDNGTDNFTM